MPVPYINYFLSEKDFTMHPILFRIGSFPIALYGVMIAVGMIISVFLVLKLAKREGWKEESIIDIVFYSVIAGLIGGRVLYILVNFGDFLNQPLFYILSRQGFVLWGGILGASPVVYYMIKKKGLVLSKSLDLGGVGLILAQAFGRIGCFFAGCCFGKVTYSFLGLRFPRIFYPNIDTSKMTDTEILNLINNGKISFEGSPSFQYHYEQGWVRISDTHSLPIFPTQLFESFADFIIFGFLLYVYLKKKEFDGQVFSLYLLMYSVARFIIEFFRGDVERDVYFKFLSISQIICIFIFFFGLWVYKKFKKDSLMKK